MVKVAARGAPPAVRSFLEDHVAVEEARVEASSNHLKIHVAAQKLDDRQEGKEGPTANTLEYHNSTRTRAIRSPAAVEDVAHDRIKP